MCVVQIRNTHADAGGRGGAWSLAGLLIADHYPNLDTYPRESKEYIHGMANEEMDVGSSSLPIYELKNAQMRVCCVQ